MQTGNMQTTNQPHKVNPVVWGALLILAGVLLFLQNMGVFSAVTGLIWVLVFSAGGLVFLYGFLSRGDTMWWAAIPGCTLLGLAGTVLVSEVMPQQLEFLAGPVFLASIGLGFVLIYVVRRAFWWAIIPAGVMATLAVVAGVEESGLDVSDFLTGSLFFIGLGVTFLVVALLPGEQGQRRWAFIPAAALIIMGFLIGTPYVMALEYLWPAALIIGGAYLVWKALSRTEQSHSADVEYIVQDESTDDDANLR